MKVWLFSLGTHDGRWISQEDGQVDPASNQIRRSIRCGQAEIEAVDRKYHLQVATIGGTLLAKLYTADRSPEHAMTIGVAPSHARSSKLLWEGMVENPRSDDQPKRPIESWCAYRIETIHKNPEILAWLKSYAQNLAFAWLSMNPRSP